MDDGARGFEYAAEPEVISEGAVAEQPTRSWFCNKPILTNFPGLFVWVLGFRRGCWIGFGWLSLLGPLRSLGLSCLLRLLLVKLIFAEFVDVLEGIVVCVGFVRCAGT